LRFRMDAYWRLAGELAETSIQTKIAGITAVIHLPGWATDRFRSRIVPPQSFAVLPQDSSEPIYIQEMKWGQLLCLFMPENLDCTFELAELLVELKDGQLRDGEIQAWVKSNFYTWFSNMTEWVEVKGKQVSSQRARLAQSPVYDSITRWLPQDDGYSQPLRGIEAEVNVGSSGPLYGRSLSLTQFLECLSLVEQGVTPKPFELLLNDARTSFAMKQYRKAVLEASVVIEHHLASALELDFRPEICKRHRLPHMRQTLNQLIVSCAEHEMALPGQLTQAFGDKRNDAAHKDLPVEVATAEMALLLADELTYGLQASK
jgi:HEPN domain-containing protein